MLNFYFVLAIFPNNYDFKFIAYVMQNNVIVLLVIVLIPKNFVKNLTSFIMVSQPYKICVNVSWNWSLVVFEIYLLTMSNYGLEVD